MTKRGHSFDVRVNDDDGEMKAFASYYLQSERDASEGKIAFLNANMEVEKHLSMLLKAKTPREEIELYTFGDDEKINQTQQDVNYRAIFVATDSFADQYREHQNKRAQAKNWRITWKYFHVEDDWMVRNGNPDGNPFKAYPREKRVEKAFREARWQIIHAGNSPKQVTPAASTALPQGYFADWTWPQVVAWSNNGPLDYFHYYEARNAPAQVTGHKYGRYIHVVGANEPSGDHPNAFGTTSSSERLSMIFVGKMTNSSANHTGGNFGSYNQFDKECVTIHEIGHNFDQFTGSTAQIASHKHGYGFPYDTKVSQDNRRSNEWLVQPEEIKGYDTWPISSYKERIVFRRYRASLKADVSFRSPNSGRDDYLRCVMEPFIFKGFNDYRFCQFHRNEVNGYGWN